jgi:large subunit ribosomal protein L24
MKIKIGDEVIVIAGASKGKKGKVLKTLNKSNKVVVEKVNIRTKHLKKKQGQAGKKASFEAPIDASNLKVVCPDTGKASRIGFKIAKDGKKTRIAKISGKTLDKPFKKS